MSKRDFKQVLCNNSQVFDRDIDMSPQRCEQCGAKMSPNRSRFCVDHRPKRCQFWGCKIMVSPVAQSIYCEQHRKLKEKSRHAAALLDGSHAHAGSLSLPMCIFIAGMILGAFLMKTSGFMG